MMIAAAVALSAALHHGVEEPARRRLVRLWSGRRALEPVAAVAEAVGTVTAERGSAVDGATMQWARSAAQVAVPASSDSTMGAAGTTSRSWPLVVVPRQP